MDLVGVEPTPLGLEHPLGANPARSLLAMPLSTTTFTYDRIEMTGSRRLRHATRPVSQRGVRGDERAYPTTGVVQLRRPSLSCLARLLHRAHRVSMTLLTPLRRIVTASCAALGLALAVIFVTAANARPEAAQSRRCGSYVEGGLYTGVDDKRIAVASREIACGYAITIVRSFRSLLPKRRHGGNGQSVWWTLPSLPGWGCRNAPDGGTCTKGAAIATFSVSVIHGPSQCSNQVSMGVAGVLILSWRDVSCSLRRAIARDTARAKQYGFRCQQLELQAGGGGALCRRGEHFVEVGYE